MRAVEAMKAAARGLLLGLAPCGDVAAAPAPGGEAPVPASRASALGGCPAKLVMRSHDTHSRAIAPPRR